MITVETIDKTARLSRLELSSEERTLFADKLNTIIGYVEELAAVDTTGVEPTAYVVPEHDALRDDTPHESLNIDEIALNAPSFKKGHFAIPKVIG